MRNALRGVLAIVIALACIAATSPVVHGYVTFGSNWARGPITMRLQLTGNSRLLDGSANFNAAVNGAMSTWNEYVNRSRFTSTTGTAGRGRDGDGINQVFFDSTVYGRRFDRGTLAITTRWTLNGDERVEGDIVFNSAFDWDSYRGNVRADNVWDIRRVALHELGHVLGLDHPDDNGQSVTSLMNSTIGNLDALTDDDITGAQSLYGGGVAGNISFPPRNEPNDFFNQLNGVYQNELRAAPSPTYVDSEGAVIWLTEYARQRVGRCDHPSATENTINQVVYDSNTLVCSKTPAGAIPFPPRDEGLQFMNALDAAYRDQLHRSLSTSFVNNEGAVVWVLEYLRYRLNGCNHGDATTKVFQQIRTGVIAPTCTA